MGTNLIGGAGAMPASSSFDEALVLEANDFFIAPSAFVAAARELEVPAADAAARKLVAPAADVAAVRTLACPAIGFFRSVPFPRADDTLLSEALAFEVSIFNGAAFLGAPPRGDAARAGGAFRGDPARGTPDVPSALGDIVSRGRPQGFARLRLDFGEKHVIRLPLIIENSARLPRARFYEDIHIHCLQNHISLPRTHRERRHLHERASIARRGRAHG